MSTTTLIYDQNHVAVPIREGVGVGGKLLIDVSALTANAWYRLDAQWQYGRNRCHGHASS